MSNIYIQEPPTYGKVLLVTSVGDIDIELWSKETPKACRNFVQLCLEGYYDGTAFHRLVKDFIVQGGDPTGTGEGGESVYGKPFRDEIHSRLRFVRRGLLAMANAGKDDNGSQFFFTLGPTPELQGKHTIFAKVAGNTIYNMLKLGDVDVDEHERPTQPAKIIRTEVLANPFEDIVPRSLPSAKRGENATDKKRESSSRATKDFKLLSFGEEAAEDEEETTEATKVMKVKGKSAHDVLFDDPRLSSVPAVDLDRDAEIKAGAGASSSESDSESSSDGARHAVAVANVKKKLKGRSGEPAKALEGVTVTKSEGDSSRREEVRREVKLLQKELFASKRSTNAEPANGDAEGKDEEPAEAENELVLEYKREKRKYAEVKSKQPKKGFAREALTMSILDKFRTKLETIKKLSEYDEPNDDDAAAPKQTATSGTALAGSRVGGDDDVDDATDATWLGHKLQFDLNDQKVLDANVHDVDRYELFDPRNPLNQRRREASKKTLKKEAKEQKL